ncbi:sesquipedalian-1-like isoform X1 [Macrosteles quadrilineatus]|uniref:sesquipedalian-1-like isoform X1 n=1 Tax=Macrosteles quadrilineatus TaxID=74068 RepID=UPI0023E0B728|nr:sesquipedalian-1-like isoform X1 [Macrosteles quadrilineatus]XP_054289447.1 sesquipedalian-1-like isoform X1 [Macrosteles quadrilineatus]XP_054289456.1 sesquipedalian-1-like isoform X1 [Macrosteles quadrilineatus]XP_054289464.1 sesquipedalian-1-like isoform X1 [Macrosteles quadrilineatus]XP_054289471.1 sesquipedalian-1-like isoform X1 [Macrosteles quadrilineatus]XP_054289476.1 sesquipedalian-1-like isoform X1 [Macrosteles quadrilineatus]
MKINEKNLAAFATSATPVDREGWLVKRGDVNKGFQRRWFVLKGNLLFYFEKRGDKEPVGVVVLEGCTIELAEDEEQFSFKIVFHGPGNRSYVLGAETQESMEQWMKALACASYDYMKLMVADLQRQLDEMEENIPVSTEVLGGPSPQPPPRMRHNPFNRGPTNGSATHHTRSNSVRSAPARADNTRPENTGRHRITFRELHTAYGRPILTDRNEWRHRQKQELEKKQVSLISL